LRRWLRLWVEGEGNQAGVAYLACREKKKEGKEVANGMVDREGAGEA